MIVRFFRALWALIKAPWVLALFLFLLLILFVWLAGPQIAVAGKVILESVVARLVATIILVFCWGLFVLIHYGRRRKREMADPEKAMEIEKGEVNKAKFKEELDYIKSKFKAAIRIVTKHNFYGPKSRSRYALPWYLLIGTTNCGKTSLVLNGGLKFPLNEQSDRHLYKLKPTEKVEVLYGNEAVFIDTPGSYSESHRDSFPHQLWANLLKRLFKVRPARPLNGIIVCVSMRDMMDSDTARREHLARTIRTRLSEVLKQLRSHVPVYLVFTKCDAVPGFAQFFTHLQRHEREQIFGCLTQGDFMQAGSIRTELKDLMQTLNAQIISKIHQERDLQSRGEMFQFPQELATLGSCLEDFVAETFGPSRYHRPVMFRGFFFTSALSAHDILTSMLPEGELQYQTGFQPSMGSEMAKGFFILNLLQNCIIPEARLAGEDKERVWGLRFRRYGMQLAAAGLFLFAAAFMGVSFSNNYTNVEALNAAYLDFTGEQKKLPSILDAKDALPELAKIEHATMIYEPDEDSDITYGLGLYRGNIFDKTTNAAYLGTLNSRFIPAIRSAAERKIDASLDNVSELKPSLRAYLMLCQPSNIDKKFLNNWLDRQWSEQYLGNADIQTDMRHHMDYLLANGIIPVEPNADIVERARKALLKIPLAELAYQQMKEESDESGKAPFTFRAAIGESPFDGDTYAIPALYTRSGYEEYLIKRCPDIIRGLTDDGWIFGSNPILLSALDMDKVHKDVRAMYFRDYIQYWSKAVQNLSVRTPGTLTDAQKLAEQMTGGISPVVLAIREVKNNTTFVIENTDPSLLEGALAAEAQRKAQQTVARRTGARVGQALVGTAAQSVEEMRQRAAEEAMKDALAVNQYFVPLMSLLDADGNPQPSLRAAHDAMTSAGEYFGKLATSDNIDQRVLSALLEIADEKDATLRGLERASEKLPTPVRSWYATTASGGLRHMLVIGASSINKAYQDKVISVYNRGMRGRYPFDPSSDRDVNLDEFATFFRAGGTLDSFHDTYLQPFVTRTGQMRSIMGRTLPVSSQAVVQLNRANRVQDAFFMSGRELGINFLLEPHALDTQLKQVNLINAGKTVSYWHGPVDGSSFTWPEERGVSSQGILETVDLNGITTRHSVRGDWALFRLFKGATIKRQSGNTCLLEVQQNGKWSQFLVQFRNKANPFDPSVCSFILPESLY